MEGLIYNHLKYKFELTSSYHEISSFQGRDDGCGEGGSKSSKVILSRDVIVKGFVLNVYQAHAEVVREKQKWYEFRLTFLFGEWVFHEFPHSSGEQIQIRHRYTHTSIYSRWFAADCDMSRYHHKFFVQEVNLWFLRFLFGFPPVSFPKWWWRFWLCRCSSNVQLEKVWLLNFVGDMEVRVLAAAGRRTTNDWPFDSCCLLAEGTKK